MRNITWKITPEEITCTWKASTLPEEKPLVFKTEDLPGTPATETKEQLMLHGLKQKLADSISGLSKSHSILEQQEVMGTVWENLVQGNWTVRKAGEKKLSPSELRKRVSEMKLSEQELEVLKKLGLI